MGFDRPGRDILLEQVSYSDQEIFKSSSDVRLKLFQIDEHCYKNHQQHPGIHADSVTLGMEWECPALLGLRVSSLLVFIWLEFLLIPTL